MNSHEKPIHGHRKIIIKREQCPMSSQSPSSSQLLRDSCVHMRRNSVTVTRSTRISSGLRQSNLPEMSNQSGKIGFTSKNQVQGQLSQPLSYQSSKEIKAISKYVVNRNNYNYSQNSHNRNEHASIGMSSKQKKGKTSLPKNTYNYSNGKPQVNKYRQDHKNEILCIQNEKTQKFQKNYQIEAVNYFQNFSQIFLSKKEYEKVNMIGKGGFGKVWKVYHRKSKSLFAMKEMSKAIIIAKRSTDSIINQRNLLAELSHQFLVNMHFAFQDHTTLYLVMPLKENGDLRYHLAKKYKFTEKQVRFIAAVIIYVLQYMHSKLIIHRDIKPENIVFDSFGYPNLTDLGIAKYIRQENYKDTSGTPGYMAPEVMFHHNHSFEVDYFALGVVIYELMMGKRPYLGKSRQEIKELVLKKQVFINKKQIPEDWSIEAADFVNKLLQRKPVKRLGWGGISEITKHSWLKNFPFDQLRDRKLLSPFNGKYNSEEVRYKATQFQTQFQKLINKNKQMLGKGNLQDQFSGYTFFNSEANNSYSEGLQFSKSTFLH